MKKYKHISWTGNYYGAESLQDEVDKAIEEMEKDGFDFVSIQLFRDEWDDEEAHGYEGGKGRGFLIIFRKEIK